ncbi:MAG: C40 family peptidase [Tatlockia sp.]|nr:C40 family peptidase [Tatlockia sp.]
MFKLFFLISLVCFYPVTVDAENLQSKPQTISTQFLEHFNSNSNEVKHLIELALKLANQNLGYRYGSAEPGTGAMDCSGTIYYLLTQVGIKAPPRSSDELYKWIVTEGFFHPLKSNRIDDPVFVALKPGDLLFWSGTYQTAEPASASHVMLYLGKNLQGEPLMVGASNGRSYKGHQIYGVSVFDFQLPASTSKSKFLGFSCIPKLTCSS